MEYDNGEHYLKEIDHVSVLEYVDEVFDHATSLMTSNSLMYGSTITAIIAGLPIVGDLDIAVSNQEYMKLCQNFSSSVKWIQVDGKTIPERHADTWQTPYKLQAHAVPSRISSSNPQPSKKLRSNPYSESKHLPINKVAAFRAVNDARVQIMQSSDMTGDRLEDALGVVRKVDFVFCGMAIDMYGRMLETIPHAYSDCQSRLIRIADYHPELDPARLKERIHKYTERGWHLTFAIDQAVHNLKLAKLKHFKKKMSVKPKSKPKAKRKLFSGFTVKVSKTPAVNVYIETKRNLMQLLNNQVISDNIRHFASGEFHIYLTGHVNDNGLLEFVVSPGGGKMSGKTANGIIQLTDKRLREKYGVDNQSLKTGGKGPASEEKFGTSRGTRPYTGGYVTGAKLSTATSDTYATSANTYSASGK